MSGPALVKSSLPILKAPTSEVNCETRARARSALGTSRATMMGFGMRRERLKEDAKTEKRLRLRIKIRIKKGFDPLANGRISVFSNPRFSWEIRASFAQKMLPNSENSQGKQTRGQKLRCALGKLGRKILLGICEAKRYEGAAL